MKDLLEKLKPTSLLGKVGLTMLLVGAITRNIYSIYYWNNNIDFKKSMLIDGVVLFITLIGIVFYIYHIVQKNKNVTVKSFFNIKLNKKLNFKTFTKFCIKILVIFSIIVTTMLLIISIINVNNSNHTFTFNDSVYTGMSTVYISLLLILISPILGLLMGLVFAVFYYLPVKWLSRLFV